MEIVDGKILPTCFEFWGVWLLKDNNPGVNDKSNKDRLEKSAFIKP